MKNSCVYHSDVRQNTQLENNWFILTVFKKSQIRCVYDSHIFFSPFQTLTRRSWN